MMAWLCHCEMEVHPENISFESGFNVIIDVEINI
jgi:hypothetical protein